MPKSPVDYFAPEKPKNPHNWLSAISPPHTPNRRWRCRYCQAEGTFDELNAVACSYVYPPCEYCGETPLCSRDCVGIAMALSDPDVKVVGEIPAPLRRVIQHKGRT